MPRFVTGAAVITLVGGDVVPALIPLAVGLLSTFVAYGRWRLAPHRGSSQPSVHHPAGEYGAAPASSAGAGGLEPRTRFSRLAG